MTKTAAIAVLAMTAGMVFSAHAQNRASDYPNRPVKVVAASAPGASIDITSRMVAAWLQGRLKQPFVVENRPGAGGVIGTEIVVKSPPDGYTLLGYAPGLSYQTLFIKNVPYDWTKDITPIGIMAGSGYAVTISSVVPARNLGEFIAYAKANPGKLNNGLAGGLVPEIEEMKAKLGVQIENIMYKGGAPAVTALSAGEVQLMFAGIFQALPMVQGGKAKVLAYTGLKRHHAMPDVPTLAESGFPGYSAGFWLGLFGPGGLPAELAQKLNREIREMNQNPETLDRYKAQGYEVYDVTPEGTRETMLDFSRRAQIVVQRLGIKPE